MTMGIVGVVGLIIVTVLMLAWENRIDRKIIEEHTGQTSVRVYRLRELESDRYVLRKVLFVQIEKTEDGKTFIAKVPWLDVFGLGETEKEATNDFQLSLIEDYELLKEEENRLSNHLQEYLGDLTTVLREL